MAETIRRRAVSLSLPKLRLRLRADSAAVRAALLAALLAARWLPFFLAGGLGFLGAWFYVDAPHHLRPIFDDSYISLTFARNIAEHGRLSFDGQHWSTGATSPLHVALLALLLKLGVEPFFASIALGVAAHALLGSSVYLLGWGLFRSRLAGLIGAGAISFTSYAALDAGNGLETSLFMALISFSIATYILNRGWLGRFFTGLLMALALLTRPEGGFLVAAIVVFRWLDRRDGEPLRHYLRDAFLLGLPAAIAFLSLSLYSLSVNDTLGGTALAKLKFFQEEQQPFWVKLGIAVDNVGYFIGPLFSLLVVAAAAPRRKEFAVFVLFWAPLLILYAVLFPGGLLHYFYRYQHPVLPFIAALAGGGAAALLKAAWTNNAIYKLLVVAGIAIAIVPVYEQYDRWLDIYSDAADETYTDLEGMALELNTIIKPDEVLATHDIGAVGYFARYRIIDLVGLVNPEVIDYHKDRELAKYLDEVRPDYLLTFPEWDVNFLHVYAASNPRQFELVRVYEGGKVRLSSYMLYRIHFEDEEPPPQDEGEEPTPPEPPPLPGQR